MMYIILAVCLVAIAAYYPIKLIKFYCMESKEQSAKNLIIRDLRARRINQSLVKLILGEGGFRLVRREADHIFEWMLMNTNEWRVSVTSKDELVVVFRTSPFHPENWDDYGTYKTVMRRMFGEHGTKDFRVYRASMAEANKIWKDLKKMEEESTRVEVFEYVRMMFGDEKVLAMVVDINDNNEKLVAILTGMGKGEKCWVASNKAMEVIPNDVAISELVRLKAEWKEANRKQSQEAARIEFQRKFGDIRPGQYLASKTMSGCLYMVDSIDIENGTATCVRLVDLGIGFPVNEKCVLRLKNGFRVATPEEVAKILVEEYCNE